ncbi:glycosyltransferase family 4 protein [Flavobacterium zhairuonense]|uniref:glycosyltransferase family 1 protein n=1 Tax=Flavobacterium zhairuonense TaxID=2493631 RepID=UPI0010453BE6|nr:glycosyltransferase family 1 protein [Flavobacterium zhairuonense]KAF2510811.1 glycosyltransferase family 4 protein [Flavobacterium zhairuonense]
MDIKAKRILVISESIDINDSSGSKGRVALINNLIKSGFDLKVLHYTPKEIFLEGVQCVKIKERKFSLLYLLSRTERVFTRITKISLNPYLESWFGFSFTFFNDTQSIKKTLKKEIIDNYDLILTLSKGASFKPHYAMLGIPEFHDKWMAYVHDPFPFHYYPRPYNWIQPGFRQKERFFLKVSEKAKFSIFPSFLLKEWMSSYFPNFQKTGIVIPHQNAEQNIQNQDLPDYFEASKFNLLHAGNLMKQRSPEGLIEGFKLFLHKNPKARELSRLLLLGHASYFEEMLEKYKANIPELYVSNGNVSFDVVYQLQQQVSVNIILESKSEISPFLPGKFPHCVEANKVILSLAPYYSETRRLLGDNYPYWAETDHVEKIAEIIENLYQLWKQNPDNLNLNRADLIEYLSADYLEKVFPN